MLGLYGGSRFGRFGGFGRFGYPGFGFGGIAPSYYPFLYSSGFGRGCGCGPFFGGPFFGAYGGGFPFPYF
jgi:hypothetical protein